ncbi:uncharacterized protein N7515_002365 [Penicillium bovifimosum]|uniref:DUF676 domain-containing protein n=1 Tax=Penicillium bovifimosum TaxID=126998 RepID=A0A9W9HBK0_9EURO|nr:uncharacterized protein N7515_002365 [Penicillium bovifimosum]KAJ5143578.1 hypothetical protein N7515_002365 [Penicillium bovifimosum]
MVRYKGLFKSKRKSDNPEWGLFSTKGAVGLEVLHDPPNAELDIIFIHSLTANRTRTWTHQNGTFWPNDLLANDIPNARIMTFGYELDLLHFTSTSTLSTNRLHDHAQSLSYALVSQRIDCSARPIIFIAHGLGGLICQQAFILSNCVDGLWAISSSAIGVVFMGTPHYGSSLSYYGEKLVNCVRRKGDIMHVAALERHLGPNDLQRVAGEFQGMLRRGDLAVNVFCFYEMEGVNDVGKIVEEEAAVLRGCESLGLTGDHCGMARFEGFADEGYGIVREIVRRWMKEARKDGNGMVVDKSSVVSGGSSCWESGLVGELDSWELFWGK